MRSTPLANPMSRTAPQAPRLLPAGLHLAAAAGAVALVAAGWLGAGEASAQALATLGAGPAAAVVHVTLPPVTVVGHRELPAAAVACAGGTGTTL